jgi:hypothetical protein
MRLTSYIDGYVNVHDKKSFKLIVQLTKARGAVRFCLDDAVSDEYPKALRIGVVVRRRLFVFTIQEGRIIHTEASEFINYDEKGIYIFD